MQVISPHPSVAGVFLQKLPELIEENVARGFALKRRQRQRDDDQEDICSVFVTVLPRPSPAEGSALVLIQQVTSRLPVVV